MREKLVNILWMVRAPLAGILVAAIVVAAILALRPQEEGQTVWVTTEEIGYGEAISSTQVTPVTVPAAALVERALDFTTLEAENLQAARMIPQGSVLCESDLLGSSSSRSLPNGYAIVQLTADSSVTLGIKVGDVLDVWGLTGECVDTSCPLEVISSRAQVIDLQNTGGTLTSDERTQLVLAVAEDSIGEVLSAAGSQNIHLVVHAP